MNLIIQYTTEHTTSHIFPKLNTNTSRGRNNGLQNDTMHQSCYKRMLGHWTYTKDSCTIRWPCAIGSVVVLFCALFSMSLKLIESSSACKRHDLHIAAASNYHLTRNLLVQQIQDLNHISAPCAPHWRASKFSLTGTPHVRMFQSLAIKTEVRARRRSRN